MPSSIGSFVMLLCCVTEGDDDDDDDDDDAASFFNALFQFPQRFSHPFDGSNAFFFRISATLLHLCVCVCVCVCIHSLALFPSSLCCSLFSNDFSQFLKDLSRPLLQSHQHPNSPPHSTFLFLSSIWCKEQQYVTVL